MDRTPLLGRPAGLLAWLGLSFVGFGAGFLLVFQGGWFLVEALTGDAQRLFDSDGWFFWLSLTAGFTLGGAGMAAAQWLLLRRKTTGAIRWISGQALGSATLALLYLALYERIPLTLSEVVHNVAAGLVIGIVQLPVIAGLGVDARRWPLVTVGAMTAGAGLSAVLVHGFGSGGEQGTMLGMLLVALTTGVVLTRWIGAADQSSAPVPSPTR